MENLSLKNSIYIFLISLIILFSSLSPFVGLNIFLLNDPIFYTSDNLYLFQKIKLIIEGDFLTSKRLGYPYEAYRFVDLNIDYLFYFLCLIVKFYYKCFFNRKLVFSF